MESPEAILFSDTIDWQWELGEWYGGNSFYWWHRLESGILDYGELSATDWTSPRDFEHGTFQIRFEILEQPTDSAFGVQIGIWQDLEKEGGYSETVSPLLYFDQGSGEMKSMDLGSPSGWWQLREDAPIDYKRPEDFFHVGLVLWKSDPLCLPMAQGWYNNHACQDAESAALCFFPMRARVTVVTVAAGHAFSGWENYP